MEGRELVIEVLRPGVGETKIGRNVPVTGTPIRSWGWGAAPETSGIILPFTVSITSTWS